jgi:hypothetical protein
MGTVQGIWPFVRNWSWGGLDGRRFWVGCGWFFFLYILISGSFATSSFRASRKVPSTWTPWSDVCVVQVSTTRRPLPHTLKTVKDCYTSFHYGLHGSVGKVSYAHAVYLICYFCYMFSLGLSSGSSDSVRIYGRVISGKQNWRCARTSCS